MRWILVLVALTVMVAALSATTSYGASTPNQWVKGKRHLQQHVKTFKAKSYLDAHK